MASKGIQILGTVCRNRLSNCQFDQEKIFNKYPRSIAQEYIIVFNDALLTSVV